MGVRTANVQDGNIGETLTGLAEVKALLQSDLQVLRSL